ncbi:MAG: HAMP domain-containing histidine kinase [Lachnospiraceae bacterium]|nr:HAMP domain-containing histidine kinase [Lachnospiraceae bacterium]
MGLKRSFFLLSVSCLSAALLLTFGIYFICGKIAERYPHGGVAISYDGTMTKLEEPTPEQEKFLSLLGRIQTAVMLIVPVSGLGLAGILFYQLKLKKPIAILKTGIGRIQMHDLDFVIPEVSGDELGQLCAAFETMRGELLRTNQKLWRQAEERRRLNAAFAHYLRNPVTVLKGTVKQLRRSGGLDGEEAQALERLETYTLRIEQYVEAMSSIQRLEQMPVCKKPVDISLLQSELEETGKLLAPSHRVRVLVEDDFALDISVLDNSALDISAQDGGTVQLDHGLFLTAAENLIGNAARFAKEELTISLVRKGNLLILTVEDDGPGYPAALLQNGPRPFAKMSGDAAHFGMGLYSGMLLCMKHGGTLTLQNGTERGASATASFAI